MFSLGAQGFIQIRVYLFGNPAQAYETLSPKP